jgi:hypothetical protein
VRVAGDADGESGGGEGEEQKEGKGERRDQTVVLLHPHQRSSNKDAGRNNSFFSSIFSGVTFSL